MSLPPSGSILIKKVNENNDFYEDLLTPEDLGAVTITGIQTITGQKTFDQVIISSGIQNINSENLQIGTSGTQDINFYTNGINKLSLLNSGELSLKSHTAYSGSDLNIVTGAVQTTDNTPTSVASLTLEEGYAYWFEVFTVGRRDGGSPLRIRMEINIGCVYREVAGSATLVGVVNNSLSRSLLAGGYDVVVSVSGNSLIVNVDGAAGETVNWSTTIFYQKISTNI